VTLYNSSLAPSQFLIFFLFLYILYTLSMKNTRQIFKSRMNELESIYGPSTIRIIVHKLFDEHACKVYLLHQPIKKLLIYMNPVHMIILDKRIRLCDLIK
jgi:hypothetical protein